MSISGKLIGNLGFHLEGPDLDCRSPSPPFCSLNLLSLWEIHHSHICSGFCDRHSDRDLFELM